MALTFLKLFAAALVVVTATEANAQTKDTFPDKPITKKPAEVRMGKGKGNPEYWAAVVEPGRILFEADGVSLQTAKEAFELAAQKLPIAVKFIVRRDYQA